VCVCVCVCVLGLAGTQAPYSLSCIEPVRCCHEYTHTYIHSSIDTSYAHYKALYMARMSRIHLVVYYRAFMLTTRLFI